ncbi:DUF2808 domain-containing protein [Nodosilinea nodulosa]|uniref:DUF2808 domain-containing protein n=1 Tax=Nodosilinea nodulosa TaxID=416001 RepID=UPI0002F65920|nr:DUF2808 domain-containing protein [Nodosilinea nodulosa]
MTFRKLTIKITLAIAATLGLQSASHAADNYAAIANQAGLQILQSRPVRVAQLKAFSATNLEGQTFFSHPPQLVQARASQIDSATPTTYEFTLTVPEDAGQPLQAVTIVQEKNLETVRFDVSSSQAFLGDRVAAATEIPLASVGGEQPTNPGEATVVFAQPVQPGSTVTIAIAVERNPSWGGVYQFGVTAYPAGENGLGQFVGYGRINFYGNSN